MTRILETTLDVATMILRKRVAPAGALADVAVLCRVADIAAASDPAIDAVIDAFDWAGAHGVYVLDLATQTIAPQGMPPSAWHVWDWTTLAWVDPRTLDGLKADKNAEINATRAALNTSSFIHDGKTFSCDSLSRSDIDGVNGYVALYGVLPPDFPGAWKAIDNSYYPLADVAAWKAFYASMVAAGTENFMRAQQLKAQLAAATTAEEVEAVRW